jgi:hypothetical protein
MFLVYPTKTQRDARETGKLTLGTIARELDRENKELDFDLKAGTILPSSANGTELSNHEWRDCFLLCYSLLPLGLPLKCDGCGRDFSIYHTLKCKYGGLIVLRHYEVTRELIELGTLALRPAAVWDEPLNTPVPKQYPT